MKNKGDKTMKKVLLTSAVALAAFGAVQAVSAERQLTPEEAASVRKVEKTYDPSQVEKATETNRSEQVLANGDKVVSVQYADGSTYTYLVINPNNQFKDKVSNPYDSQFNLKDGKVQKVVPFTNGTHGRINVKDKQGAPVAGVEFELLVYKTTEDFLNAQGGKPVKDAPALVSAKTNEAGDAEFELKEGGVAVYRILTVPKGYFLPERLTKSSLFTADAVGRNENNDMYVNASVEIEKTDSYNVVRTEWVQGENGWHYYDNNKQVTGWKQIDGKWYFFNAEGVMQKWWVKDGNTWYYLNGSGAMETGWLQDGGKWYFLEASGAMKASQWFEVAGKWYYVDGSGALAVNTTVGGYTVNGNGEWVK